MLDEGVLVNKFPISFVFPQLKSIRVAPPVLPIPRRFVAHYAGWATKFYAGEAGQEKECDAMLKYQHLRIMAM